MTEAEKNYLRIKEKYLQFAVKELEYFLSSIGINLEICRDEEIDERLMKIGRHFFKLMMTSQEDD